jgi:hypothetical protein
MYRSNIPNWRLLYEYYIWLQIAWRQAEHAKTVNGVGGDQCTPWSEGEGGM